MGLPIRPQSPDSTKRNALSHSFIRTVQHLIERCITFYLDRDDCVKALAKHAGIEPVITITVWKELEKENKEFFEDYLSKRLARRACHFSRVMEDPTNKPSNQHIGKNEAPKTLFSAAGTGKKEMRRSHEAGWGCQCDGKVGALSL